MALQIQGKLKTEWGDTETAYVRIEFYKVQPWTGTVEYNPLIFVHHLPSTWEVHRSPDTYFYYNRYS